jgi:hypothetical protein
MVWPRYPPTPARNNLVIQYNTGCFGANMIDGSSSRIAHKPAADRAFVFLPIIQVIQAQLSIAYRPGACDTATRPRSGPVMMQIW